MKAKSVICFNKSLQVANIPIGGGSKHIKIDDVPANASIDDAASIDDTSIDDASSIDDDASTCDNSIEDEQNSMQDASITQNTVFEMFK